MSTEKQLVVAMAEGIARGLIEQTSSGIKLTESGQAYALELWGRFGDLDKLVLSGYIGAIIKKGR